jgi:hypothetical protein
MNGELKNVVTTFGKTFNVVYSIEDSQSKRRPYIDRQDKIKKDDKDADTHFDIFGHNPILTV